MNERTSSSAAAPPAPAPEPALITANQLACMMQISLRTLWRLRSSGLLPEPVKLGSSTRWRLNEVRQWIAQGCPSQVNANNDLKSS